jgi:hypothetical protein
MTRNFLVYGQGRSNGPFPTTKVHVFESLSEPREAAALCGRTIRVLVLDRYDAGRGLCRTCGESLLAYDDSVWRWPTNQTAAPSSESVG